MQYFGQKFQKTPNEGGTENFYRVFVEFRRARKTSSINLIKDKVDNYENVLKNGPQEYRIYIPQCNYHLFLRLLKLYEKPDKLDKLFFLL